MLKTTYVTIHAMNKKRLDYQSLEMKGWSNQLVEVMKEIFLLVLNSFGWRQ